MARTIAALALGVVVAHLMACATSGPLDSADAGRTTSYDPGVPNFDMEAVVRMDDAGPAVDVFYSLPLTSLVFRQSGDGYTAEFELLVRLVDRAGDEVVAERTHVETLRVSSYDSTRSFDTHRGRLDLEAAPGELVVDAVITDFASGETARRRQAVTVAGANGLHVSRILVEAQGDDKTFAPVVSLHVPALVDSLRAAVELYNLDEGGLVELSMLLVRYETDTTVAAPPYWLDPPRGSLAYRGIDHRGADTVQTAQRILTDMGDRATAQFILPRLGLGLYSLSITGRDAEGREIAHRRRSLSVKSPSFPRVTRLEELIESMAYIAYDNEIGAILEGGTPMERKRRFDAFWGGIVSNRTVAANLIELYFSRIEEANLLFTGYKEGWKTDRGMIYTVLGPPVYVDQRIDMELWYYSYGDRDPIHTYVFERVEGDPDAVFDTYILQRRPYYQNEWARSIDRWRDGDVL